MIRKTLALSVLAGLVLPFLAGGCGGKSGDSPKVKDNQPTKTFEKKTPVGGPGGGGKASE